MSSSHLILSLQALRCRRFSYSKILYVLLLPLSLPNALRLYNDALPATLIMKVQYVCFCVCIEKKASQWVSAP
jgi:hypothetical protein